MRWRRSFSATFAAMTSSLSAMIFACACVPLAVTTTTQRVREKRLAHLHHLLQAGDQSVRRVGQCLLR